MKNYITEKYPDINLDDLFVDGYGYRTYDTYARSKEMFNIDEAILITSGYHLARSIFLCNQLGIKSIGVSSTISNYEDKEIFYIREILAIDKALIDIYLFEPKYSKNTYKEKVSE